MRDFWPRLVVLLLSSHAVCLAQSTDGESRKFAATESSSAPTALQTSGTASGPHISTCPSRTVNYITHTLPQQCLRTDRITTNATPGSLRPQHNDPDTSVTTDTLIENQHASSDQVQVSIPLETNNRATKSTGGDRQPVADHQQSLPDIFPTSSTSATPTSSTDAELGDESDSPLDNANFLSFEDWKKQNLAKAGQSPEHVGQGYSQQPDGHRQRPGINNALEGLGDENEIEIDFSGFRGASSSAQDQPEPLITSDQTDPVQSGPTSHSHRSKDAGMTCKERTNYASFDCAATVLKTNPECKSASSVLVENKDSYMLNTCSASNKFFIVELCNDILIDTIVLANYEFFSSIFRHFRVSVSDRYPVKVEKWKDLGTYEARNTRGVQAFLVENPLIWARYLRIEFLSHYGSEYYCPLSLLRVHGTTMLEEFRHQEELGKGDSDDEEVLIDIDESAATPSTAQNLSSPSGTPPNKAVYDEEGTPKVSPSSTETMKLTKTETNDKAQTNASDAEYRELLTNCSTEAAMPSMEFQRAEENNTCNNTVPPNEVQFTHPSDEMTGEGQKEAHSIESHSAITHIDGTSSRAESKTKEEIKSNTEPSKLDTMADMVGEGDTSTEPSSNSTTDSPSPPLSADTGESETVLSTTMSEPSNKTAEYTSNSSISSSISKRSVITATSAAPAQPSTQESFFKSVHKRLQQLESNSTLSLQYIEEQSRILRDAFSKVEKKQVTATSNFLTHLNDTVMTELHGFRQSYDQLWQSTVIELEAQREQYQREMLALSSRLTLVADELVWQKRMGIAQSTLLLLCLGLVLFARNANGTFEMPIYQQVRSKSQAALNRMGLESPPSSPSPNRSPVSRLRPKIWRTSTEPLDEHQSDAAESRPQSKDGLEVNLMPPTPTTADVQRETQSLSEDDDGRGLESRRHSRNARGDIDVM